MSWEFLLCRHVPRLNSPRLTGNTDSEILIQTHLMLAVERQLLTTGDGNGQAMIFGNFAVPIAQQETLGNTG